MSQQGEGGLNDLVPRPNIVPSSSSERNDSLPSLVEGEAELNKRSQVKSEPGPPPNGGLKAWQQVLGAFFLNFNTWSASLSVAISAERIAVKLTIDNLGVLSILSVSSRITTPLALSSQLPNRRSPGWVQSKGS